MRLRMFGRWISTNGVPLTDVDFSSWQVVLSDLSDEPAWNIYPEFMLLQTALPA
jgi:hypothetical protein